MLLSDLTKIHNLITEIEELQVTEPNFNQELIDIMKKYKTSIKEEINKKVIELDSVSASTRLRIKQLKGSFRIRHFQDSLYSDNTLVKFRTILESINDWQFPACEIFPGVGQMLPHVLAAEPLYIVDWDKEVLDNAASIFNDFYANKRLMRYVVEEYDFSELPQKSFGLVYCLNYIRYENLQGLIQLAKSVWDLLSDGGHYFFVYTPLDKHWGAHHYENGFSSGADTDKLLFELSRLGFEIVKTNGEDLEFYVAYVLVKKPGNLHLVKSTSVLAKIIDRPDDLK